MKAGIVLPQLGNAATRENLVYVAREAEKIGLDSIWAFERLLWPLKPQSPYVASPDGSLPVEYQRMFDPLETLSYLAANTERVSLGTCVLDMLFQNPVTLARRFATLDNLSGGRVIAGLGIGWSKDEYEVAGIPFNQRGARADEFVQILKRIWTEEVVEFKGKFYRIPPSKIGPKPVQKPHPPIILGGFVPSTFSRIVKYADGWLPIAGFGALEQIGQALAGMRENAKDAGRDPSGIRAFALSWPLLLDSSQQEKERMPMTGTIDQIGSDIARIKAMGVEHLILGWAFTPIGKDMNKMLDVTSKLARFAK